MKIYMLTQADLDELARSIDRDPDHGLTGKCSSHLLEEERHVYREAHRFYNYQVMTWIEKVSK